MNGVKVKPKAERVYSRGVRSLLVLGGGCWKQGGDKRVNVFGGKNSKTSLDTGREEEADLILSN